MRIMSGVDTGFVLQHLAGILAGGDSGEVAVAQAMTLLSRELGATRVQLWMLDDRRSMLDLRASAGGVGPEPVVRIPVRGSWLGAVALDGAPLAGTLPPANS